MCHSPSRSQIDKFHRQQAERRAAERSERMARAAARGKRIVSIWNIRADAGRPAELFPTIRTAIVAGHPILNYMCPACRQVGYADLRKLARSHHPRAPISVLIPALSCNRCCPKGVVLAFGIRAQDDYRWPFYV
jgi:hypothetical protein